MVYAKNMEFTGGKTHTRKKKQKKSSRILEESKVSNRQKKNHSPTLGSHIHTFHSWHHWAKLATSTLFSLNYKKPFIVYQAANTALSISRTKYLIISIKLPYGRKIKQYSNHFSVLYRTTFSGSKCMKRLFQLEPLGECTGYSNHKPSCFWQWWVQNPLQTFTNAIRILIAAVLIAQGVLVERAMYYFY